MNTFLPFDDFDKCAKTLDSKRLLKQVVETKQILDILGGKTSKWIKHPAVKMWVGHEECLKLYFNSLFEESLCRGINWTSYQKFTLVKHFNIKKPPFLGDTNFHYRMRCNLCRKAIEDITTRNNWELYDRLKDHDISFKDHPTHLGYLWPK